MPGSARGYTFHRCEPRARTRARNARLPRTRGAVGPRSLSRLTPARACHSSRLTYIRIYVTHWIAQLTEVLMAEDMVMRSVYVRPGEDANLRQLAHDFNVTTSDLIRSSLRLKLKKCIADHTRQTQLS